LDKYEYKVRSEEIKDLIGKKKFAEAMKIADTIDWRRVKSVNMLCTISDLYKLNRRYEESREILQMAYEKHPGGRMIVYSLCELSIKLDDVVAAVEYYKEFVQIAPRDNGRYVLQYKLYEAQEVSLEERIAVLEELKHREYREKWAYELAYLYHRIGLSTKCVEECDELILWFGEGKYVTKAMELKMLHAPLSEEQQKKYKKSKGSLPKQEVVSQDEDPFDIEVKPVNVGQYATINLQRELAESMKEVLGENKEAQDASEQTKRIELPDSVQEPKEVAEKKPQLSQSEEAGDFTKEILSSLLQNTDELYAQQEEIADPRQQSEVSQVQEEKEEPAAHDSLSEDSLEEEMPVQESVREVIAKDSRKEQPDAEEIFFEDADTQELPLQEEAPKIVRLSNTGEIPKIVQNSRPVVTMPSAESMAKEKNENFDKLLSQEYDGQLSLAVPPQKDTVEKQITGQMSIEDILSEWERMKKENEEKRAEAVRQRVREQTGEIFSQFDASTKQGLLAELDALAEDSIEKEKKNAQTPDKEPQQEQPDAVKFEEVKASEEKSAETPVPEEAEIKEDSEVKENSEVKNDSEIKDNSEIEDNTQTASEADAEKEVQKEKPKEEEKAPEEKPQKIQRMMTPEEKKLFGPFIQTRGTRDQILEALDNISLASYTGNLILTGEPGMESIKLAKNIIREIQMTDSNFSGKLAKITGQALNHKDLEKTFEKLSNGALIVEHAGELNDIAIKRMTKLLEQEKQGIIVILEDTKINMNKLLDNHGALHQNFNLRIDVEALDNDSLVLFARKYALEKEYAIDELGVLALYTRIAELQTSEHSVTTKEIKEIVDEAIYHADRKNIGHFMDVLFGRRYDEEDMIILREKDFV
jgi:hypothetical protein